MICKIGVVGGKSKLFNRFKSLFLETNEFDFLTIGRRECDIILDLSCDFSEAFCQKIIDDNPSIFQFVIFAGITKPDECSNNLLLSYKVNVIGLAKFISVCLRNNKKVLFLSTDAVFNGENSTVTEYDNITPSSDYGVQKALIEDYFKDFDCFKVLRLSYVLCRDDFLFNPSLYEENNVLFKNFKRNIIVEDDFFEVLNVYMKDFGNQPEILHVAGPECVSKYEIANDIADYFGYRAPVGGNADNQFFSNRAKIINLQSNFISSVLARNAKTVKEWLQDQGEQE